MLNKLEQFLHRYKMLSPGDHVVCAVSGGADSVALLFGMYLLKDKLGVTLSAAHFNHCLRGAESDRDEQFVRDFCAGYGIELTVGSGEVVPGKKGLEAAARDARYRFLTGLGGKIATAHTADDNAETVLLHLIRGTGLKGLGGITPIRGNLIRPMLGITRQEVMAFLQEYHLHYITDSSNDTDLFLRNRIRHHVMPLLQQENPKLAENLSDMAQRLRLDEAALTEFAAAQPDASVSQLSQMHPALRNRWIASFLRSCDVPEPESEHISIVEDLIFSQKPSARANLPGGVVIARNYDTLEKLPHRQTPESVILQPDSEQVLEQWGVRVQYRFAKQLCNNGACFTIHPVGPVVLRSRQPGDAMRLTGGTKELKKLFIDRKIPASQRERIPVIADKKSVLGVYGIGPNLDRVAQELPAAQISITLL